MSAVAELKTPDGTFLIQERRKTPRDASSGDLPLDVSANPIAFSSEMAGLGGLIILGVFLGSFTTKYDATIGHSGRLLAIPEVGFLILQLFLARAAFRSWEDVRSFPKVGDFVASRFFRYLPATIPSVLLGFLLLKLVGLPGFKVDASSLPANLLLLADMVGVPEIDSAHWRIKIEVFQAVLVAMAWFGPFRRHLAILLTGALFMTAMFLDGEPARHNVLTLHGFMTSDGYMPCFAFGIALSELARDKSSRVWQAILVASGLLAGLSNTPIHGLCVLAALAILSALAFGHLKVLGRCRLLNQLGEIGFPVYMIHFVAGFTIINQLERLGCPAIVAILAASCVAVIAGKALNMFVERPMQKRGPVTIKAACAAMARVSTGRCMAALQLKLTTIYLRRAPSLSQ